MPRLPVRRLTFAAAVLGTLAAAAGLEIERLSLALGAFRGIKGLRRSGARLSAY